MKETIEAQHLNPGDVVYREGVSVGRTVNSVIDRVNSVRVEYYGKVVTYPYGHKLVVERKQ